MKQKQTRLTPAERKYRFHFFPSPEAQEGVPGSRGNFYASSISPKEEVIWEQAASREERSRKM